MSVESDDVLSLINLTKQEHVTTPLRFSQSSPQSLSIRIAVASRQGEQTVKKTPGIPSRGCISLLVPESLAESIPESLALKVEPKEKITRVRPERKYKVSPTFYPAFLGRREAVKVG